LVTCGRKFPWESNTAFAREVGSPGTPPEEELPVDAPPHWAHNYSRSGPERWGWAVYQYGRWVHTVEYGWVWVPDDLWGPAWVDWRYGKGHVGWAPMPPEKRWRGGAFVSVRIDLSAPRYQRNWVFVSEETFVRGNIRARRKPPSHHAAMLQASTRVTNYASVNGRIVNRSLDIRQLSVATKIRIRPASVTLADSHARVGAQGRGKGHVSIYRPRVAAKAAVRSHGRIGSYDRFEADSDVDIGPSRAAPVDIGGRGNSHIGIGARGPGIGVGDVGGIGIGR